MSPEQAEGRIDLFGPASDIYTLGANIVAGYYPDVPHTVVHRAQRYLKR